MSISVKRVLRKDKMRKDGTAPIWIRVTANRRSRYLATGVRIEPEYWNEKKQEVRGSHELVDAYNAKLKEQFLEASKEALGSSTAGEVKAAIRGESGSLTGYFQDFIDALDESGQFWEWKKYKVTLGKLKACFGESIQWQEIDPKALRKFERYLRHKRKNNVNTARKELGRLRRVFRQAEKDREIQSNPFRLYDMPKAKRPNRRKLSFEEVRKLEAQKLDGFEALARDAFVFSFYAGGMRFGDLCSLKPENVDRGRVTYTMMKTGQQVSVPLPKPALAIVERHADGPFVFPFLEKGDDLDGVHLRRRIATNNTQVNEALKEAAKQANMKPDGLSMHVARHSYADFARQKGGGDLHAIMNTLGHTTLHVTQAYLKSLDNDSVDKLADRLWNVK